MIRGWCPSLHEPMATGDGMLVRVKPRGGVVSAAALRLIVAQASAFGSGVIELTGRANLQIRGLAADGLEAFARAMVDAGLASADAAGERRRNVIGTPLGDIDRAAHPRTGAVATALEVALGADRTLAGLPGKFGFVVDGGGMLPPAVGADIRVSLFGDEAEIGCDGADEVAAVGLDEAVATALGLARAFLASKGKRMRDVDAAELFAAAGLGTRAASRPRDSRSPIGAVGTLAFGGALPFGSAMADVWRGLADLAERHGDARVRLTPWRTVLIAEASAGLPAALEGLGLIVDPLDARLRVSACTGQPGCASASVVTRALAAQLRPPVGSTVHVSGCEKGCAHPGAASVTLVGREGSFDVVRNGRAGDAPARRGLSPAEALVS